MHKSRGWHIIAILLGLFLLSLPLAVLPALAEQPTPPPASEEDELLRYLKLCRSPKVQQTNEFCQRPSQPPATYSQTAKIRSTGYIKGLYITYYGLGSATHRAHVQELLETTELNAIVMDVKGDRGYIPYTSTVQLAVDIGAGQRPMVEDWAAWMQWFHDRNIYTIARIVTFKDEPLASAHPEWAVLDAETGAVWRDRENLGWTDPMREEVWDYNIALAVEAAQQGFDEIQFDYVRFPSDGAIKRATFADENSQENRIAAISGFLAKAHEALAPYHVKLAVDVFGYTTWRQDDMGIGQQIEAMAPYLDVLSPMLYPSTFADGLPGLPEYKQAIAFPYDIVNKSTSKVVGRVSGINPALEVRPWLQDFRDYNFDRRTYTPDEIRLQMEGARQAGGRGWLLWDPRVQYTPQALVSAQPAYPPNQDGQVLVLAYHLIGEPEDRWQRTPANFRADLECLLAEGYYPVNLRDLATHNLSMVPAGKRPLVLTFDDSSSGQFRILPGGKVDPNSAVGILLDFHQAHPADWPLRATFFVLQDVNVPDRALFGQPEWAQSKLQMLVDWGMEIGSHTISHANLAESSQEEIERQLARSQAQLEQSLPGYRVVSLSIPFGAYPRDKDMLKSGQYQGQAYQYLAAVSVAGGLAPSPQSPAFDPYETPRVQAIDSELAYWLNYANQAGVYYVSAGE